MTGREILDNLSKLTTEQLNLQVIGVHGSSGESMEVSIHDTVNTAGENDNCGCLCDMQGEQYIFAYLGN